MPPSWHPVPACTPRLRCRRAILSCSIKVAASIPKSWPEIKNRCSYKNRRRNYSSLQLRKLESDAEDRCHYERSRRNHSSVTLQKLESDAEDCRYEIHQAKPFFCDATKIRIGRGRSLPLRNQQAKPFSPASIRKSGPEIKNHCTKEGVNRQNPAVIPKLTP